MERRKLSKLMKRELNSKPQTNYVDRSQRVFYLPGAEAWGKKPTVILPPCRRN